MAPLSRLLARIALAVACLAAAFAFGASTVSQRSPFTQGHWWNPARAGSGFDIFNASDQVMVIWYTYDESGHPTWYTAQGNVASLGTAQAWPLLQHHWSAGHKAQPLVVGTLTLNPRNAEGMDVAWKIGDRSGTWPIVPFMVSGTQDEVDHSGSWFDPAHPGWGITVTQQGDVLGGVLYAYDAQGAPTWLAGFDRGRTDSAVQLYACTGACPWCAYTATVTKSAGQLGFEFSSEIGATIHPQLALALPAGLTLAGASIVPLSRPASMRAADRQLVAFDDAPSLKAFLDKAVLNLPPPGQTGSDFSAPPPPAQYSTTNLQEQGVDEADVVKTDGQRVFAFAHGYTGGRRPFVRVASVKTDPLAVQVDPAQAALAGSDVAQAGLYLAGSRLAALYGGVAPARGWSFATDWRNGATYIDLFDVSGATPAPVWHARVDGYLVSSRRIGDRLYVVSRYVPFIPGYDYGIPSYPSNAQIVANTTLDQLLPRVSVNDATAVPLVSPSTVLLPPQGERGAVADFAVVTTIDLTHPRIVDAVAILGGAEAIYASSTSLVLATSRSPLRGPTGAALPSPPVVVTDIHQLALDASGVRIVGSATVEGYLGSDADKAAFRLSEYQGRLRVVTSSASLWSLTENRLSVLEPSAAAPGLLKTVSTLPNAQRPDALGKPDEFLYATRFVGDRLYAVTFPSFNPSDIPPANRLPPVDPLFVVDLADAADPRIVGELVVPGFSEYLHPLPNGLMLGFGRFVDTTGAWQGLQLSLYDVRDAGKPVEKQRVIIGKAGSDSALLRDHHALATLLDDSGRGTIAFPVRVFDGPQGAWQYSGMARYELRGASAADMQLVALSPLAAFSPTASPLGAESDPTIDNARALLNASGAIFVGHGRFWWQNTAGAAFGPQ